MDWYQLSIKEALQQAGADPQGLSTAEVKERQLKNGRNELQEAKKKSIAQLLFSQFTDVMILVLLAAAVVSGFIGDLTDTIVILVIVFLNAAIGFLQEFRAEKAMKALKQMTVSQARVLRDGSTAWLPATELVTGDMILLEAGNAIPADVRITESFNLTVEEAALTGESQSIIKTTDPLAAGELPIADQTNMAFKGTFVTYGRGSGVVVATGMQTQIGHIANLLQDADSQTPLQQRMTQFGKRLSVIILLLCIVFLVAGLLRHEDLVRLVLTSISMAVAAIPEALPAVITISLALAAKRMIRQHTLIRKLPAVETLGSVTYICTDKTGTLTKNKMYVEEVYIPGQWCSRQEVQHLKQQDNAMLLLLALSLNNDAAADNEDTIKGDSTEVALMELSIELNIQTGDYPRLAEIAFDANRKLMTTFHKYGDTVISFTKGAPDVLLDRCNHIDKASLQQEVNQSASQGKRIMGYACRYWDAMPGTPDSGLHEQDLIFLGFTSMIDPPREEVIDAVAQCKGAGIVPVMITGDHPLTAKAIAERIGIISSEKDKVLNGQELSAMEQESFLKEVEEIKVYARVSPEQKLDIVTALQQKGHFVAMTGDGVNDAPSLKKANIGIAMGITGSDVSKEAAHMILLDDNFSTIVRAIREGRRIYDNILKFIEYLMTTNSGELWTLLIGPLIGLPIALLPIHILWINLVTDGLPAISLSFEKAEKDIMDRPPRPPQESVFANGRGLRILYIGILMAGIALSMQAWAIANELHWQTIVFNVICLSQMGNVMAIRSQKQSLFTLGLFSNRLMVWSVIIVLLLQVAITYIAPLQLIFHTEALSLKEFLLVGLASSFLFFAGEIQKVVSRLRHKKA